MTHGETLLKTIFEYLKFDPTVRDADAEFVKFRPDLPVRDAD